MPEENHPSREALNAAQLAKLNALLGAIIPGNMFYKRKFGSGGLSGSVPSLKEFFKRFPFTTKQELVEDQEARPPYGSNVTYAMMRYTRCHQTSGTSGIPIRWLDTPESWDWMLRYWTEVYQMAGVTDHDRVYCAFSFGPFLGFWLAFEAAARMGCLTMPGGGLSSLARLRAILDHNMTVLCSTPTYAIRLAELAHHEKIDLGRSSVRVILVAGEPGGSLPATRAHLESLWPGTRVFDHHGMTEVGPVTHECPERKGVLHIMESGFLPEILVPGMNQPVEPGEAGELILTPLGRSGSPLIRYRTGDLVRASTEPVCACGRSDLALEGGILGRTDDMVIVRGVNVYPTAVEQIIRGCDGIAEYEVAFDTKSSMTEMNVTVEPGQHADPKAITETLEKAFQTQLSLRVPIKTVSPGGLPRYEMKAKRWKRAPDPND